MSNQRSRSGSNVLRHKLKDLESRYRNHHVQNYVQVVTDLLQKRTQQTDGRSGSRTKSLTQLRYKVLKHILERESELIELLLNLLRTLSQRSREFPGRNLARLSHVKQRLLRNAELLG